MSAGSLTGDLTGDLREHLYRVHADGPLRGSHWVMSAEWFGEVRKLADASGRPLFQSSMTISAPQRLLGIPVEIRAGGGVPHLEPDS